MLRVGFHASHEQVDPARLLRDVRHAEQAGFTTAMCSDHFSPWTISQGHSGQRQTAFIDAFGEQVLP